MKISYAYCYQLFGAVSASPLLATTYKTGSNPLATAEQRDLDALAIKISQDQSFSVLKGEAKLAFQTAHGLPISQEANSSLDAAIEELAFRSLQKAINSDPYHPKVYWVDAGPRNWFGLDVPGGRYSYDNPDCIYRTIPIDHSLRYVITGHRYLSGPADVTFSLISDPNSQNTVAHRDGSDLVVNEDGSYTITIDSSSGDGKSNHIQSTLLAKQLFVRNNLGDWLSQTPDNVTIEILDDVSGHSPMDEAGIIAGARWNLQESIIDYGVGALGLKTMINGVNKLGKVSQSSTLGTLTTQASSFGHFSLNEDQALVATVDPGASDYFVFPITDPWLITTDPGNSQVSLNNQQAAPNSNGTYTFVISMVDPLVYNWLNTTGLHEVTAMVRWQGLPTSSSTSATSSNSNSPSVTVQLVQFSDLPSILPGETRYVTADQRQEQLAQRVAGYARRLEF